MISCKDDVITDNVVANKKLPECIFQDNTKIIFHEDTKQSSDFSVIETALPDFRAKIRIKEKSQVPLLVADKPWESKGINYSCVLKVEGKWRMWYEAFDKQSESDFDTNLCYAESNDGIAWIKPDLKKVKYNDSLANNILMRKGLHGMSIFYDENATPDSRYKMVFTKFNKQDDSWIYGMSSADGIHFKNLVLLMKANSDTQTAGFFDKGKYHLYLRYWDGGRLGIGRRTIGYSQCSYFGQMCFPLPVKILAYGESYDKDLYNNAITKLRDDLYIMFPSVFDHASDTVVPHLAVSTNGLNFQLEKDQEFIHLGKGFDSSAIYVAPGCIPGDAPNEFIFYYSGKSIQHSVELTQLGGSYTGGVGRFVITLA